MGKDFWRTIRTIIIIAALAGGLWFVLKWFGGVAQDNAGDIGVGKYEQQVDGE